MTSTNIISSLGAGSGIDVTGLVSQLTAVERAPQQERIDTTKTKLEAQISGYGKLKSAMDTLSSAIGTLADSDLFNARNVDVPSSDVITANKVLPGAQTGTYQVVVNEVASAQSIATASNADRSAALGKAGTLSIDFGTWAYDPDDDTPSSFAVNDSKSSLSIDISATDSLDAIADKINSQKAGVQASVIKVSGQYQLTLTSDSGAANAMRITGSTSDLDDFAFNETVNSQVTETMQAKDAELTVNGLTVTRESNKIDDVIDGLDFTINKAAPTETLSFAIRADTSTAEQAVRDFVDAYNTFQTTSKSLVGYSRDESNKLVAGDLATDGSAKTMVNRFRQMMGGTVPGLASGFTALTNIGIRTELDGSIAIDETDFSAAFSDNFEQIESLFSVSKSTTNSAVTVNLGTFASKATAGTYNVKITQDPTHGQITGEAISTSTGFNLATGKFSPSLDTSTGDYSFAVKLDGVTSNGIKLTGTYSSAEELRADLQSKINGDSKLKAAGVALDVTYDESTDSFSFASREYGSATSVSFTSATTDMEGLGIKTSLTGTAGLDVKGTIDGADAFGSGNVLLPSVDSPAYGLNLTVNPGAAAQTTAQGGSFTMSFSRGMAGELANLIKGFEDSSGEIQMRLDNIQTRLDGLTEDQTRLDTRMDAFSARMLSQFTAMEAIINSLSSTGDSMDNLINTLPFTASNN